MIGWQEAQDRHLHRPQQPNHTFYFHVDEDHVIDAKFGGNSSRWINHSCNPNCYADERDGRIFITALRNIQAGEELNYDYGLIIEERYTPSSRPSTPAGAVAPTAGARCCAKRGWAPPVPLPPSCRLLKKKRRPQEGAPEGQAARPQPVSADIPDPLARRGHLGGGHPRCCRALLWRCCPPSTPPTPS